MATGSALTKLLKIVVESAFHSIGPDHPLSPYKAGVASELEKIFRQNEDLDVNPRAKVLGTIDQLIRKTNEAIQRRTDAGETRNVERLNSYLELLWLVRDECEKLRPEGDEGWLSEPTRPGRKI